MTNIKHTKGARILCGCQMTSYGMSRHLSTCAKRNEAINIANQTSESAQYLYHLKIKDTYTGNYWLYLEMNDNANLFDLDDYLRAIWLECCGHLSEFTIYNTRQKINMRTKAKNILEPGMTLLHIYDFGTSSKTLIEVVDERFGQPLTTHPIFLMARNEPPEILCQKCERPATVLIPEWMEIERDLFTLCEKHARKILGDSYSETLPIVNSPRTGMCGYTGPAEPPY
mgnify:FL=1